MTALFSPESHIAHMLAFEAALARAQARAGLIPPQAADAIAAVCRTDAFDVPAIYRDAATAGTLAIPLVRALTNHLDDDTARYVHLGATSQDAVDTALVLQMRTGLDLLIDDVLVLAAACASLAERHRHTPMAGRTLLQQAVPITFGLKAARWLGLVTRQIDRLRDLRHRALALQFGGAAGTLAALGADGPRVAALLGEELGLPVPDLPWHAERDRVAEIAAALGVLAGATAKTATDIVLLRQTEIGELSETTEQGKGGSSAMPHKLNPVDATMALAAARLAIGVVPVILNAMTHEHERAAGAWQAEWDALPNLFCYTASTVAHTNAALAGVVVDPTRMRANLDSTGGLIMAESLTAALTPHLGRPEAFRVVQSITIHAQTTNTGLQTAALADPRVTSLLSPDAISAALDPASYLGSTNTFIDRALATYHALQSPTP